MECCFTSRGYADARDRGKGAESSDQPEGNHVMKHGCTTQVAEPCRCGSPCPGSVLSMCIIGQGGGGEEGAGTPEMAYGEGAILHWTPDTGHSTRSKGGAWNRGRAVPQGGLASGAGRCHREGLLQGPRMFSRNYIWYESMNRHASQSKFTRDRISNPPGWKNASISPRKQLAPSRAPRSCTHAGAPAQPGQKCSAREARSDLTQRAFSPLPPALPQKSRP